ncbi:MAG: helix-turn-helix domain-containing protein [Clostridia bacterium]|nr:helix-turn-helix domain-containing protein [Clostridia bacterium]
MPYQTELQFFCRLMENFSFQTHIFAQGQPPEVDKGLRRLLELKDSNAELHRLDQLEPRKIYAARDSFACSYKSLLLPDGQVLLAGPYLQQEMTDSIILRLLDHHHLPTSLLPTLRQYYATIPYIEKEYIVLTAFTTLGETLWGSKDNFTMEYMESADLLQMSPTAPEARERMTEAADLKLLEARYDSERRLMHAVSHGQTHQAQMLISRAHESVLESRVPDAMRNLRNYGIVLNTLLRKAAEQGSVHPLHIDKLSSAMARRMENVRTPAETFQLFNTMVHKYCLLVKTHSMQNYSQLVQHVILRIETDLASDLSLKAHADHLNVNASYLSTLFKKETGMTLTEYVNRSRIDHAIFLLNTTDMQVQSIAQSCGVPDVNYFTKLFKRMIGKTPKEYRQDTRRLVTER